MVFLKSLGLLVVFFISLGVVAWLGAPRYVQKIYNTPDSVHIDANPSDLPAYPR